MNSFILFCLILFKLKLLIILNGIPKVASEFALNDTAQKIKFSIKYDQIRSFLLIWSQEILDGKLNFFVQCEIPSKRFVAKL